MTTQSRGQARPRKPRVDLTADQVAELARLYGERPDITTDELARRFGVARASVAGIARRQGVSSAPDVPARPEAKWPAFSSYTPIRVFAWTRSQRSSSSTGRR